MFLSRDHPFSQSHAIFIFLFFYHWKRFFFNMTYVIHSSLLEKLFLSSNSSMDLVPFCIIHLWITSNSSIKTIVIPLWNPF